MPAETTDDENADWRGIDLEFAKPEKDDDNDLRLESPKDDQ
jgi:hypothetical protein